jgi:hypothetical protein
MKYSYTTTQQLLDGFHLPTGFKVAKSDPLPQRWLDKSVISTSRAITNLAPPMRGVKINCAPSNKVYNSILPGFPIQAGDTKTKRYVYWDVLTQETGKVDLPVPTSGEPWVQGMPRVPILPGGDAPGAYDRHYLLIQPDGTAYECIHFIVGGLAWQIGRYGVWKNGKLITGKPVCRGEVSLTSILLGRGDPPHMLALNLSDYGGGDGTVDWEFPRSQDRVTISPQAYMREMKNATTPEQKAYLDSWRTHGALIYDKNGAKDPGAQISYRAGAEWDGTDGLAKVNLTMDDLYLVTSVL